MKLKNRGTQPNAKIKLREIAYYCNPRKFNSANISIFTVLRGCFFNYLQNLATGVNLSLLQIYVQPLVQCLTSRKMYFVRISVHWLFSSNRFKEVGVGTPTFGHTAKIESEKEQFDQY